MTKEEKIAELINIRDNFNYTLAPREVFDDAIKALEQEPCEDAISRAEAILQIQRHGVGCFDPDEFSPEQAERFVINMLNELSSVKPEPKTGHWIQINSQSIYECSECSQIVMTSDICAYEFCHGCGCRMIEPQESEVEK